MHDRKARKAAMILYRLCWVVFVALVIAEAVAGLPFPQPLVWVPAALAIVLLVSLSGKARAEARAKRPEAVEVRAPVSGRWSALNSPANKVPSHGLHTYGQTYAIDIVAEPDEPEDARPGFAALWPVVRRSSDFPAFGAPLLAVADATVVSAGDSQRDHLSRNSFPAMLYMLLIEGGVREVSGAGRVVGNHIVLDLGGGTYAMYAHVQHGSLAVRAGDRVVAGQQLGRCGNSGNSSEPHVHFQLMDGPDPDTARGIPFRWRDIGVPRNGEPFTVAESAPPTVVPTP